MKVNLRLSEQLNVTISTWFGLHKLQNLIPVTSPKATVCGDCVEFLNYYNILWR